MASDQTSDQDIDKYIDEILGIATLRKTTMPQKIKIDEQKLLAIKQRAKDLLPLAIREDPHCSCNDANCPHKQSISPLFMWSTACSFRQCLYYDGNFINDFKPYDYPIYTLTEDEYRWCNSPQRIQAKLGRHLYTRYKIPIKINKIYRAARYFDIFEGIEFDPKYSIKYVTVVLMGVAVNYYLNNNILWMHNTYLPIKELNFVPIEIILDLDQEIDCYIYGGELDYDMIKWYTQDATCIHLRNGSQLEKLICDGGMISYDPRSISMQKLDM